MPTIATHIDRILRVAAIAEKTDASINELHDINTELGLEYFDDKTQARLRETNVAVVVLEAYLETLEIEQLRRIHALMYSGRDGESPSIVKRDFEQRGEGEAELVRTIVEKRLALGTYLPKGILNAQLLGIDVETF